MVLTKKDYYEILGIEKTASEDDIKRAYRKVRAFCHDLNQLALKLHPDKNRAPKATDAFKKLSQAFACLSDPEKRKNYDRYGSEEQYRQHFQQQDFFREDFNPNDIFRMFFQQMSAGGAGLGPEMNLINELLTGLHAGGGGTFY